MRNWSFIALVGVVIGLPLQAALYTYNFGNINAVIPDNSGTGYANNQTIDEGTQLNFLGGNLSIASVVVRLDISGGMNGDLYAYVRHQTANGTGFTVLLDRVGTAPGNPLGSTLSGFGPDGLGNPFRLTDSAAYGDVHNAADPGYNGHLAGTWRVDQSVAGNSFTSFQGLNPLGTWSLFLADYSGENVSTLNGWGLEITAVPEPVTVAGLIFSGLCLAGAAARRLRARALKN
jgi:hypothetical protein